MAVITNENKLKDSFKLIFESKSMQEVISDLNTEDKNSIYEIKEFFKNLTYKDFEAGNQIKYKNKNGFEYLIDNIKGLSEKNTDEYRSIIRELYKCFNKLYPWNSFRKARELAVIEAEKLQSEEDIKLKNNMIDNIKSDRELFALLTNIHKNRAQIQKLVEEADYTSKRLREVKTQLANSEKDLVNENRRLAEELKKENESSINHLQSFVDSNSSQIKSELDEQHENVEELSASIKELQERLNAIDNGVYREELATYFLREHDSLKGKIDPIRIFIYVLVALLITNRFESAYYWSLGQSTTMFLRLLIFLIFFSCFSILGYLNKKSEDRKEYKEKFLGLLTPYWCWLFATLCGMGTILHMALRVCTRFESGVPTYNHLLPYASIYLILIWFTWFASKQFSYTKQICDEYEYKYALAKSYMNYKNEAVSVIVEKEGNPILLALLDSVIKNIAHSPVQSVKQDVHTPFSEVVKAVNDVFPKQNK